jgi:hypothetical protein
MAKGDFKRRTSNEAVSRALFPDRPTVSRDRTPEGGATTDLEQRGAILEFTYRNRARVSRLRPRRDRPHAAFDAGHELKIENAKANEAIGRLPESTHTV